MPGGVSAPPPLRPGSGWGYVDLDSRVSQWGRAEFAPEDTLEGRRVMKASAAKKHAEAIQELLDGMRRYDSTRFFVSPPATAIRNTALNDTSDYATELRRYYEADAAAAAAREQQRRNSRGQPSNLMHTLLTGGTL